MNNQPAETIELQDFVEQGLRYLGTIISNKYITYWLYIKEL